MKDYEEAYEHQTTCVACVVRLIQAQQGENWNLPLLYTVSLDLRLVALKAEAAYRKGTLNIFNLSSQTLFNLQTQEF